MSTDEEHIQLAVDFLEAVRSDEHLSFDLLDRLLKSALSSNETISASGTGAFFGGVVEPLCDSFSKEDRRKYYRVMAHTIQTCRGANGGRALDEALTRFGCNTEDDLIQRTIEFTGGMKGDPPQDVERIFLLSRVTLGADVAVTSRAIRRLRYVYPQAKFTLLGGSKLDQIFGGDDSLQIASLDYPRRGGLLSRMDGWLRAIEYFDKQGFSEKDLIIDPDTRITQVGLLPLVMGDRNYHFFEGVPEDSGDERSLGDHFAHWLDQRFHIPSFPGIDDPYVSLREEDWLLAKTIFRVANPEDRPVVTISLGVGGNADKRLGADFEKLLLDKLLEAGCLLLLDKGGDPGERAQVDALLTEYQKHGKTVMGVKGEVPEDMLGEVAGTAPDIVTWDGAIGPFAAMIGLSSGYIGYDSLFQHLAAALGTPAGIVFTGYSSEIFAKRWRPGGPGPIEVFTIGPGQEAPKDLRKQILQVLGIGWKHAGIL